MARQPITTHVRGEQLTLREVSDRCVIAYEAVRERYYRAKKRGEDLVNQSQKARQTKRLVLALLEQEFSGVEIARVLGCTTQAVS